MKITTDVEGQLWKLAVATLGTLALEQLVVELLKGCVKTRAVNMYGFLRLEWLGEEASKALRRGQRLAGVESEFSRDDPTKVAVLHYHSSHLLRGIVQALPLDVLPLELLEWRMQLLSPKETNPSYKTTDITVVPFADHLSGRRAS